MKIGMVDSGVFTEHPKLMGQFTAVTVSGTYGLDGQQLDGNGKTWKAGEPFNVSGNYDAFFNDSHGTSAAGEMVAKRTATGDPDIDRMHGIAFDAHLYSANTGGNDSTVFGPNVDYAFFKETYGALARASKRRPRPAARRHAVVVAGESAATAFVIAAMSLLGKQFSVLNAAKGIDGRFDAVAPNYQFLGTTLDYEPPAFRSR